MINMHDRNEFPSPQPTPEPKRMRVVASASWIAPVLWRFRCEDPRSKSARGLAQSKTLRVFGEFMEKVAEGRVRGFVCDHSLAGQFNNL